MTHNSPEFQKFMDKIAGRPPVTTEHIDPYELVQRQIKKVFRIVSAIESAFSIINDELIKGNPAEARKLRETFDRKSQELRLLVIKEVRAEKGSPLEIGINLHNLTLEKGISIYESLMGRIDRILGE